MYPYTDWDVREEQRNYVEAMMMRRDDWVTAACGTETPCLRDGRWMLYCYNPARRAHGWLDMATDMVEEE